MNSYAAEETIDKYKDSILVRFSRLFPELLTITVNTGGTKIHQRKPLNISIEAYLKKEKLNRHKKVPLRLDWLQIKDKNTISQYVLCGDSYVVSAHQVLEIDTNNTKNVSE